MGSVDPTPEKLQAFLAQEDEGSPIVMINLLRYREQAAYPEGFAAGACSGREAYRRYGAVAAERVASVGGRVLWAGEVRFCLIAPEAEQWDDAVLVEYPSRKAFLEMVSQPAYQAIVPHRSAALADSRLIATTAQASQLEG
jgi:uncharacterized protein (DUF1330 family)